MSSRSLKILVVGDANVGKTSLTKRFVDNVFVDAPSKNNHQNLRDVNEYEDDTLTADFVEMKMKIHDKETYVSFWECVEQSPPSFFANAHGCCLVFSTLDPASLKDLETWYDRVRQHGDSIPVVIAENKIDLIEQSRVDAEEVERAAKHYKFRLYRTSAKDGHGVTEMFEYIAEKAAKYLILRNSADAGENGSDSRDRVCRTASTASWLLPPSTSTTSTAEGDNQEPSKRRTKGVKTVFNKNKCPMM